MAVIERGTPFGFSFSLEVVGALADIVAEISKDNAGFLPIAGVVTEKDLGWYGVALTSDDTDARVISFRAYLPSGESFSCVVFLEQNYTAAKAAFIDAAITSVATPAQVATALINYDAAIPDDEMALTSGERTTLAVVVWNSLTSGMSTLGSVGKLLVDNITASLANLPGNFWNRLLAVTPAVGSIGEKIFNWIPGKVLTYGTDMSPGEQVTGFATPTDVSNSTDTLTGTLSGISDQLDIIQGLIESDVSEDLTSLSVGIEYIKTILDNLKTNRRTITFQ